MPRLGYGMFAISVDTGYVHPASENTRVLTAIMA